MLRVGKIGVSIATSTAMGKIGGIFRGKESREEANRKMVRQQAEKVVATLGQMKGAAMKVGQILSSDPDLLPPDFADIPASLQNESPPMTWLTVKSQIETALDRELEAVFSWFDPESLGSASIGQVHRARLHTGEEVAVKVQYPGILDTLESDMRNLRSAMTFARAVANKERVDRWFVEVRDAILAEADYEAEARNLDTFIEILAERPGVRVPKPIHEWTRTDVLVMEFIDGEKLDDALIRMGHGPEQEALLERFVETHSWLLHVRNFIHADPHPGNFLLDSEGRICILDFGCVKQCEAWMADGILDIMVACWEEDDERAAQLYRDLGFGSRQREQLYEPSRIRAYHEIVLAPFLNDGPFDFKEWDLTHRLNGFLLKNPSFMFMSPPPEGILMLRLLAGIKGLLTRVGAQVNVRRMGMEMARKRGRLSDDVGIL